jgi:hypothetical protein
MMDGLIPVVVPFAAAVVARLAYRYWPVWLGFVAAVVAGFALVDLPQDEALIATVAASLLGFAAPDLARSAGAWIRRPQTFGYVLIGVGGLYLLTQPQLAGFLVVALVVWAIMRPYFGGRRRRR